MNKTLSICFLFAFAALCASIAHAKEVVIFPMGSEWSYNDKGKDLKNKWLGFMYDARGWDKGKGELGYGDDDEATVISFGDSPENKHITTYFRKTFNVRSTKRVAGLKINMIVDDGALVYINGKEVARHNLSERVIDFSTLTDDAVGGDDEKKIHTFNVPAEVLRRGENIIAVEVHQQSPSSSDLSFNMELLGILKKK